MTQSVITVSKGVLGFGSATGSYIFASLPHITEWMQCAAVGIGLLVAILSGISVGFDIRHKIHLAKRDNDDDTEPAVTQQGKQQYKKNS